MGLTEVDINNLENVYMSESKLLNEETKEK